MHIELGRLGVPPEALKERVSQLMTGWPTVLSCRARVDQLVAFHKEAQQ